MAGIGLGQSRAVFAGCLLQHRHELVVFVPIELHVQIRGPRADDVAIEQRLRSYPVVGCIVELFLEVGAQVAAFAVLFVMVFVDLGQAFDPLGDERVLLRVGQLRFGTLERVEPFEDLKNGVFLGPPAECTRLDGAEYGIGVVGGLLVAVTGVAEDGW